MHTHSHTPNVQQVVVVEQTENPEMLKARNEERLAQGLKKVGARRVAGSAPVAPQLLLGLMAFGGALTPGPIPAVPFTFFSSLLLA